MKTLFAAGAVLGGVAAATTGFAEETASSPQPQETRGMMTDHGGMMNMMGQMRTDRMKQMSEMVGNCDRMMESMSNPPTGPSTERAPGTGG